ncbi:MAG TPA: nickel pincer cofactor biosynthesis protein LarC [Bryobacteraceae bacterium]|nr:nickel pincer cofactor biosynthesis protein LarC [Bryobacteraceae bacterium]
MKICYLDAFSGISGDMTVGALVDAGADALALKKALDSLGTGAEFRFEKTVRRGIAATKFHVDVEEGKRHRHLPDILELIARSELSKGAKKNAGAVFERLGQAEAKVHAIPLEKVHFHEVGAVDSICDIAGACAALDLLDVDAIHSSPVNVGSGSVKTEHGVLPVPAPATAELLACRPIYARGPCVELTTPTGAAIASTLAIDFGPLPPMRITSIGYGAGTKDFPDHANVLRILIGEVSGAAEATTVVVLEANIDDASPQVLGYAMERLLEAGALDVTMESLLMKKSRPGSLLRVIAKPENQETLANLIFTETTTLGLRIYSAERRVKARRVIEVETPHGRVRVKISEDGSFAPEYEDCRKLAREFGVPLKEILAEANLAYLKNIR